MQVQIEALGETMLLVRFGTRIDEALNARVHAAVAAVQRAALPGIRDIVPAYATFAVNFDPPGGSMAEMAATWAARTATIERVVGDAMVGEAPSPRRIELPVCYGGAHGVDLEAVAAHAGLGVDEVIARHGAPDYRVAMLGFAPGFAYLLGLDERLQVPRRDTPRTRVPAGSVAIGGAQTGIYPHELPGGWQLIGRTPRVLFDASRGQPALLAAGDLVRFVAVDAGTIAAMARS